MVRKQDKSIEFNLRQFYQIFSRYYALDPRKGVLAIIVIFVCSLLAIFMLFLALRDASKFNINLLSDSAADKINKLEMKVGKLSSLSKADKHCSHWEQGATILTSTQERRLKVLKNLSLNKGEYLIALFSVDCRDCENVAVKLNQLKNGLKIIGIAKGDTKTITEWSKRLNLSFEVKGVSEADFYDLGAVILPSLVIVKDGIVVEGCDDVEELDPGNLWN